MTNPIGVQLEQCEALRDIQNTATEYGAPVVIYFLEETGVNRDAYGTIKSVDTPTTILTTSTNDITRNPNERKLDGAGIREHVDIILWTPMKDWIDQGYTFNDLDVNRDLILFDGKKWKISDKGIPNWLGNQPLYITIGLKYN